MNLNEAHVHLLLNHTPILGSLFGLLLLLAAMLLKQSTLVRAALVTLVAAAVLAIPTQLTGEGAEEIVEHQPGITHAIIHEHEEAAELSLWVLEATGALALVSLLLVRSGNPRATLLTRLTLVGALASFGLMARTGLLGGQISHPEARADFVVPASERGEHRHEHADAD